MRRSLLSVSLVFLVCLPVQGGSQLVNGGFDLGDSGGVACEWVFDGSGTASVVDAKQVISSVPPGEVATLYQIVPLCELGARYRLSVRVAETTGADTTVMIGLAPKANPEFEEIVWAPAGAEELATVEVVTLETNQVVYLSVTNPAGEPGTIGEGGATFDYADLAIVEAALQSLPPSTEASPVERLSAQQKYAEAVELLKNKRPESARPLLCDILDNLPEARPEAAMALVGMQEVEHFNEMFKWDVAFHDRDALLGVPYLRAVLQYYPDQTDACAMARCKIGEFYLGQQILEMAGDQLHRTLRDFPNTQGAVWAKTALINYHMWKDETESARECYEELQQGHAQGTVTTEQLAWAEHRFESQRIIKQEGFEAYLDFMKDMWERHKEDCPGVALYCKNERVDSLLAKGSIKPYEVIDEYEELVAELADAPSLTAGFRVLLADQYVRHGWKQEHIDRAHQLLEGVIDSPDSPQIHVEGALSELKYFPAGPKARPLVPEPGKETLRDCLFEKVMGSGYKKWEVYGDRANWPDCDWWRSSPTNPEAIPLPAWNSVNCGEGRRMETVLLQRFVRTRPNSPFRASVMIAGEGFLGGDLVDTFYEIRLKLTDPMQRPLAEFTTGEVPSNGVPKAWQHIVLEGQSPPDAYLAEYMIRVVADGEGHHAYAATGASLKFHDEGGSQ